MNDKKKERLNKLANMTGKQILDEAMKNSAYRATMLCSNGEVILQKRISNKKTLDLLVDHTGKNH